MSQDHIRYDILVQEALRGVVRKVMGEVAKTGLPGDHHFFISFITKAPGVRISQKLLEQYEKEMTIVIQNQYWDFKVGETSFEVGLSFDGQPETLEIPFSAIKGFFDPSVQFGLQFDVEGAKGVEGAQEAERAEKSEGAEGAEKTKKAAQDAQEKPENEGKTASKDDKTKEDKKNDDSDKIVSLDSFRKK